MSSFSGLGLHLGNLSRLSGAKTRSISPENFTGEKGKGGMATEGTGAEHARGLGRRLENLALGPHRAGRDLHARRNRGPGRHPADLDDARQCPLARPDPAHLLGRPGASLGRSAARRFLRLRLGPVRAGLLARRLRQSRPRLQLLLGNAVPQACARITLENRDPDEDAVIYYQINYALTEVPEDAPISTRSSAAPIRCPSRHDYVILDGVKGRGQYVGTYMAWGVNNAGWWGEGEIKFFIDGDKEFPTICGTGTEDYFCGAYNFDAGTVDPTFPRAYSEFTTPYSGLPQVIRPDGVYRSQQRFGLYRWHIMDPIRFEEDLSVTIQALGWRTEKQNRRYLPLQDDIASVAYWYQTLPTAPFPAFPDRDYFEII